METYEQPVTIKQLELAIIEKAWAQGGVQPRKASASSGKKVAVVGSGPSGLACAQQLARLGHAVTVFEKSDRLGGLLRYGIPEFKLEKALVQRRVLQMEAEGVKFTVKAEAGIKPSAAELREDFDAVVICAGAGTPRDLKAEGRELKGIHFALEYLTQATRVLEGDKVEGQILAAGKNVIVVGGGDTGADCISTALRQGAKSVTTLEILPRPPLRRDPDNPWPQWARVLRKASAHEEGGQILYSVKAKKLSGESGVLKSAQVVNLDWMPQLNGPSRMVEVPGSAKEYPADLMLLAMGFSGVVKSALLKDLGLELDPRGNIKTSEDKMTTVAGVFAAGDARRGQSLVVWAIAEGRQAAESMDKYLMNPAKP
jgi:glutamate synthase (NADPH/NADH) small chain